MNITTLADLYQYFDNLAEQDADADLLFVSSYLRGFIALSASEFGDESQLLTLNLAESISTKLHDARTELTPNDRSLVNEYWEKLAVDFSY